MNKRWTRGAVLGLVLAVAGLAASPPPAAAGVHDVDTPALEFLLDGGGVFLLDVRTPGEYARGHIEGAVPIPMNQVPSRLGEIPRDGKVVVVCATGARSAAVARFLVDRGYPWVANYVDGVVGWYRKGLPLAR